MNKDRLLNTIEQLKTETHWTYHSAIDRAMKEVEYVYEHLEEKEMIKRSKEPQNVYRIKFPLNHEDLIVHIKFLTDKVITNFQITSGDCYTIDLTTDEETYKEFVEFSKNNSKDEVQLDFPELVKEIEQPGHALNKSLLIRHRKENEDEKEIRVEIETVDAKHYRNNTKHKLCKITKDNISLLKDLYPDFQVFDVGKWCVFCETEINNCWSLFYTTTSWNINHFFEVGKGNNE